MSDTVSETEYNVCVPSNVFYLFICHKKGKNDNFDNKIERGDLQRRPPGLWFIEDYKYIYGTKLFIDIHVADMNCLCKSKCLKLYLS